jgi:hypothetical protein
VDVVHSKRGDVLAQSVSTATAHLLGSVREELAGLKTQQRALEVTLNHTVTMVQDLCTALRSNVQQTVARQVQHCNRTVVAKLEQISSQQQTLQMLFENQQQQQQQQRVQQEQMLHQQQSIVYTGGLDDFGGSAGLSGIDAVADLLQDDQSPASRDYSNCSYATQQTRTAAALNYNALEVLRTTARRPICSTVFPVTWEKLYNEWITNDLQSFLKCRQQHWDDAKLVNRYAKRCRAMKLFRNHMISMGGDDLDHLEVVRLMDEERERRGMSLSKHITFLFNNDPTRTRRIRVQRKKNNSDNK